MASIGIGDALFFIEKAIQIYKKIEHDREILKDVHDRLKSLPGHLRTLEEFLKDRKGLAGLRPEQADELRKILDQLKADAKRSSQILEECHEKAGPAGLQFRFDFLAQSFFSLGGGSKELEQLAASLERGRHAIIEQNLIMQSFGINALLANANSPSRRSPSPRKLRKDLSILFVDGLNTDRSVISQAYAQLVREWTTRTGNPWRISRIHSAGIHRESRGELVDVQKSLKLRMTSGEEAPNDVALAALFDNKTFDYPYKQKIKQSVQQQKSRGLTKSTFSNYDYLIVFTYINLTSIERLRDAVRNKYGDKAVATGKAETILLGRYVNSKWSEIREPKKQADGSQSREDWNKTISVIKVAFKGFLKKELGWVQPPQGAVQRQ